MKLLGGYGCGRSGLLWEEFREERLTLYLWSPHCGGGPLAVGRRDGARGCGSDNKTRPHSFSPFHTPRSILCSPSLRGGDIIICILTGEETQVQKNEVT